MPKFVKHSNMDGNAVDSFDIVFVVQGPFPVYPRVRRLH